MFNLPSLGRVTGEGATPAGGAFRRGPVTINPWMRQVNALPTGAPGGVAHINDPAFTGWLHQQLATPPIDPPRVAGEAPVGAHPSLAPGSLTGAPVPTAMTPQPAAIPPLPGTSVTPGAQDESGISDFPSQYKLTQNPLLTPTPSGAFSDSEYLAADALLRKQTTDAYARILEQLGFTDPSGAFIPGSVYLDAQRNAADLNRSIGLADESTTQDAQRAGTLFSGVRGTLQARAEYPYVHSLADLNIQTPRALGDLYNQATGLISDFTLQQNQLLAEAARRQADALAANPPGAGGGIPDKPGEAGAVTDYLAAMGVNPQLFTGFAPNPGPPVFNAPAAEQDPTNPNYLGPGSTGLGLPATPAIRRRRPTPLYGGQQTHGI